MFTAKEISYLKSQPLARIATVARDGQPDVTPVGFEFDGTYFFIGGHSLTNTRKYENIQAGQPKVGLVIDDLKSVEPWYPRGIRIYGTADLVERDGRLGHTTYIRITPQTSWSWNVEDEGATKRHKTIHSVTTSMHPSN